MNFIFCDRAGDVKTTLMGEKFIHIFKSRRTQNGQILRLTSFDSFIHEYKILEITKKSATLELINSKKHNQILKPKHLILAMIDPVTLEKILPFLNQFGVTKLTLFYAKRSQRFNFNLERATRILINSNEQCGRFSLMEFELLENLESVINHYPDSKMLDFSGQILDFNLDKNSFIIGPEGGFSEDEKELAHKKISVFRIDSPLILKAQSAAIFATLL